MENRYNKTLQTFELKQNQNKLNPILIQRRLTRQIPLRRPILPTTPDITSPTSNLIKPTTSNKHTRDSVNNPNQQRQKACSLLADQQQYRLKVILKEDAGDNHRRLRDRAGLTRRRVLVREDCVTPVPRSRSLRRARVRFQRALPSTVQRRHDREEVLELVVMLLALGDSLVEWVLQSRVMRPERELRDHVREVEG